MRKWIKWIGVICLVPIALVLLISVLVYIPPFQRFVVGKVIHYATEATGMQIGIGKIRLTFPLNLKMEAVSVIQPPADTLLTVGNLTVSVKALPLLKKEVVVDGIDLEGVKANTGKLIDGIEIKGTLGKLSAQADRIDLKNEHARFNRIDLSDTAVTLFLTDTTSEKDTTSTPLNWKLQLDAIALKNVAFAMQIPADSLRLCTFVEQAELNQGEVDLGRSRYGASAFRISGSTFRFDTDNQPPTDGLDVAHLALSDLNASLRSMLYEGKDIEATIQSLSLKERSGLRVESLAGSLRSDSTEIKIPDLKLRTPYSEINLQALVPWSALQEKPQGEMRASLDARLGKEDLLLAGGIWPEDFKKAFPTQPLTLQAEASGNFASLKLDRLKGKWPGILDLDASGEVKSLSDSLRRSAQLDWQLRTGKLDFVLAYLPAETRDRFRIPSGLAMKGNAALKNQEYRADVALTDGTGKIRLDGRYQLPREAYAASLTIDSLQPIHFMPHDSLLWLTASVQAEGKGLDLFAASTWSRIDGKITDIRYGSSSVSDITIDGSLKNHQADLKLVSRYPLAKMNLTLDATLQRHEVAATLIADVENADLYGFHLISQPFATSFQLFAEAKSNLKEDNTLDVTLGDWQIVTANQTFRPKLLTLHAASDRDTTRVSLHAGDLGVILTGNAGLNRMIDNLTRISQDADRQLKQDSTLNLNALRPLYPDMHLEITAGQDNPIYNYLQNYYIEFKDISVNAYTSPETGLRLDGGIYGLMRDTFQLDTIRALVWQDSLGLRYRADVVKTPYRRQAPFSAAVDGMLRYDYADARLTFKNGQGETGLLLGARVDKIPGGMRIRLFPDDPILAFRKFSLNPDNFIQIKGMKDISANLRLTGPDNAALWVHSSPKGRADSEVHVELNQINLGLISNAVSYIPPMSGRLNADFQYAPTDSSFMVVADVNVDSLYYENDWVGQVTLNAIYLPLEKGNHQVDVHLFRDHREITSATALYQAAGGDRPDRLTGSVDLLHLPLDIANPFIPEQMAVLSGDLDGHLDISGTSAAPEAEGYLLLDSSAVFVGAVGSSFRFDTKKIEIRKSRLLFDQYAIYASGDNPFLIDGTIDFHDFSRMMADLKLSADNLQLLNVKRNNESLVYGKLFVNLSATAKGPVDALTMRGNLELLGNTNVTYVLKDSPLTVQDRMSDMVTFVSFADTVRSRMPRKPPLPLGGLDMLMTITIDPAVRLNIDLTPDQSSHVNLEGGGDLSFQYTPEGNMILNGRYTLTGGTVKYSLPVIPLKDFSIQEGSYVQWTGDVMNPTLNLTATERVRASVSVNDQSPRMVNFDVGIVLKQTLENLSLQFTLNAPEDMAVQNQLAEMGEEERTKQAVSMLVTGMYLAGGGGGGKVNMNMGSALNSFLQSEINNIAGSALKSVDITFGMESYDENGDEGGGKRTDYSFSFAKRFYNDRIRVVVGGRISTGENINNGQAEPFIDNISVEYRLDTSGSRYIKLFHDTNYESLLEGEITETGAGIVLRKKMMHLRELFNFKKKKVKPVDEEVTK